MNPSSNTQAFPQAHIDHYQNYYLTQGYDPATSYQYAIQLLQQNATQQQQQYAQAIVQQRQQPAAAGNPQWPATLQTYVNRVFAGIDGTSDHSVRENVNLRLRELVNGYAAAGTLWSTDWEQVW